jgi:hypothetical protein
VSRPTVFSAAGTLIAYCAARPKLLEAITDNLAGQPRAQSFDEPTGSTQAWCWEHQRPVNVCHHNDLLCAGEGMRANDPTGEAAVNGDQAADHQREVEKLEAQIVDATERLDFIRGFYLPKKLPTGADRAKLATAGDDGCHWCLTQAKTWSPPCTEKPSTVANNLNVAVLNCRAHYDFIRTVGRAPSPSETQTFVKSGRWPKQRVA